MEINEIWTHNHSCSILTIEMGDINGNGQIEVIATTKNGKILCFSLEGKLILEDMISNNKPLWHSKLFDMDGDGRDEIILGGMDGSLRVFRYSPSNTLEKIWTHQFNSSISGILLEDVNDNGQKEIISYSLDKTLRVLDPINGNMKWGQIFENGIGDAIIWSNPENLNQQEIVACGNDGTIRSFNRKNGELKWFKRYSDKLRCISSITLKNGQLIATGGDDRVLHFIDTTDHEEIKSKEFNDYVWKLYTFPNNRNDKLIVSTYSFDYLNDSIPLENFNFTSKLICIDSTLEILWEINGINIESLEIFEFRKWTYLLIGTTKGIIMLVDGYSGKKLVELKKKSCVNMAKYLVDKQLIFSCHNDGSLFSFKVNYE